MTKIKSAGEILIMKEAGRISKLAMEKAVSAIDIGITKRELDSIATKTILSEGGKLSFTTVDDYKYATCITINDEIVHGIPDETKLQKGDIVSIDLGTMLNGLHTDCATSRIVGESTLDPFLSAGHKALLEAIKVVKDGVFVGDISSVIQQILEKDNPYHVSRELTGHGIGTELHEDPFIPGFGPAGRGPVLKEGMTIAIETIYAKGTGSIRYVKNDGWTLATKDGSDSGLFEDTVLVGKSGPIVLTGVN